MGSSGGSAVQGAAQGAAAGSAVMPGWGTAIGGIAGLAGGLMAGHKASEYEQQQQQALAADQAARQAFMQQQQNLYGPIQQRLTQEAANPMPLDYGLMAGQINRQTAGAQRNLDASMAARGMTGSGLQAAGMQGLEQNRVQNLSSAFQQGLDARRQLGLGLLHQYTPLGNAQFGQGGLPYQMGFGEREQGLYNDAAMQNMQGFGQGLGALSQYWMQRPGSSQAPGGGQGNLLPYNYGMNQGTPSGGMMGSADSYTPYPTQGFTQGSGLNLDMGGIPMPQEMPPTVSWTSPLASSFGGE